VNETHDPRRKSWIESANRTGNDFPLQNLPYGVFRRKGRDEPASVGVAIGDRILDISSCLGEALFTGQASVAAEACCGSSLNALMSLGRPYWSSLRQRLVQLLDAQDQGVDSSRPSIEKALVNMSDAELLLPVEIGDYTDFYASVYHATNVGKLFRPETPLLPNYKYVPVGYHARASSIVVSGTDIRRPRGQVQRDPSKPPDFVATGSLDYELEVGLLIGPGNRRGDPIPLEDANDHMFGLCLVNDWSARDIQRWEYQPLGPFLGKNFATTISPWVVTMEALEPFRVPAFVRPEGDPPPLPYLHSSADRASGGINLWLEVFVITRRMKEVGIPLLRLSRGNSNELYWTFGQLVAHHTSNGCNLRTGDLLASGTVSGSTRDAQGCLLELTRGGKEPIALPGGEMRRFLEDGDEITFRGFCAKEGFVRIGFGECRGTILPPVAS
jgi:fumarylacetoacetase